MRQFYLNGDEYIETTQIVFKGNLYYIFPPRVPDDIDGTMIDIQTRHGQYRFRYIGFYTNDDDPGHKFGQSQFCYRVNSFGDCIDPDICVLGKIHGPWTGDICNHCLNTNMIPQHICGRQIWYIGTMNN